MPYVFTENEASSDESGKGDFFGGLHVCAVFIDTETYKNLKESSFFSLIQDSKALTNELIKKLAPDLIKLLKNNYCYKVIKAEEYNEIYSRFHNLNVLLAYAHNAAWQGLVNEINNADCKKIIDQFCTEALYKKYLSTIEETIVPIDLFQTKAESSFISCAIASILARYSFVLEIESLQQKFQYLIPFGNSYSSSNCVINAFKSLELKNKSIINHCKQHFVTLKKIRSN